MTGVQTCALPISVAQAMHDNVILENVDIKKLQQTLMQDDCYIPWHQKQLPELTKNADCSHEIVRNGMERCEENCWIGNQGDVIEYRFKADSKISQIRLIFDSDFNRNYHNMPCNYPLVQTKFKLPETLIREYKIEGISENGQTHEIYITDNHQRFVTHNVDWCVKTLRFVPIATFGAEQFRLFSFEMQ